ncbi:hypothetical protein ACJX0J_005375, partial [Zea mays]
SHQYQMTGVGLMLITLCKILHYLLVSTSLIQHLSCHYLFLLGFIAITSSLPKLYEQFFEVYSGCAVFGSIMG